MKWLSKYDSFLEEASINLPQLNKRGNVLIDIISKDKPLFINDKSIRISKMKVDGEWVDPKNALSKFTDIDGNYDIDKAKLYFTNGTRYQSVFKDIDGNEFKLNQFTKTKEFGSSGPGRSTKKFESTQCIFLAIKQSYPYIYLNSDNFISFYKKFLLLNREVGSLVHLSEKIDINEDLMNEFINDKNWISTFCDIPNRLWSTRGYVDSNIIYGIYHVEYKGSDSPYNLIYKKYREFSNKDGFQKIDITKWCPADVYLMSIEKKYEIMDRILHSNNIKELNVIVDEYFDSKELIPISLKKIDENIPFNIIINNEREKELPNFYIKSFIIGSDMRGIASKISTSSVWKYRNNKDVSRKRRNMNFDSSNTSNKLNVDGEVEGSTSRHGKISFVSIKRILDNIREKVKFSKIYSYKELSSVSIEDLEKMVLSLTDKIIKSSDPKMLEIRPVIRGKDISGNLNRLISRVQSLQIILSISEIYNYKPTIANDIITKIFRYALSIQTDKFNTPRYLRII